MSQWKTEHLFFDGDEYYAAVLEKIMHAHKSVQMESYIFELDEVGLMVLDALGAASKRGLIVQLLVDGVGALNSWPSLVVACQQRKIQLRSYHPVRFDFNIFKNLNKRNHRKIIIIDGHSAFLGSFNVSRVHSKKLSGKSAWNDSAVFVEGPQIHLLARAFVKAWKKHLLPEVGSKVLFQPKTRVYPTLIRLNSKVRWRYTLLRDLLAHIYSAKKRILITNAYFLPRRRILRALRTATKRGVYVGICVPEKSDAWIVSLATRSLYLRLLKDGAEIYEYEPAMMHSKTLVVDDWAVVGSHNLNHRSLMHDLEAEAVITHPDNIEKLVAKWKKDISVSKKITLQDLGGFSFWNKLFCQIAYWFKYWI